MNELEFLHQQVSLERRHMAEVRSACQAAIEAGFSEPILDEFGGLCAAYLVFILDRFNAQDQKHVDQLHPRLTADEAGFAPVLDDLRQTLVQSREAVDLLRQALDARRRGETTAAELVLALQSYLRFYEGTLRRQQPQLAPLFARHYDLADWRAASFVTADSVLEERSRFAAVSAQLPPGIELKTPGRSG
jgi:hypothetical protein